MRSVGAGGRVVKSLYTYLPCMALLQREHRGQGGTLALGSQDASSGWRIIQTELLANGDVMVTLKALTAYGIIPELNSAVVAERFRISVVQALHRAVEAAFRETPISVIDQCRNAVTVVLSRWLVQEGADEATTLPKDLRAVVKALEATIPHWSARETLPRLSRSCILVARPMSNMQSSFAFLWKRTRSLRCNLWGA
jgi:hypothetical protein